LPQSRKCETKWCIGSNAAIVQPNMLVQIDSLWPRAILGFDPLIHKDKMNWCDSKCGNNRTKFRRVESA